MPSFVRLALNILAIAAAGHAAAEVTLYGREDFRGRAITVEAVTPSLEGTTFGDRASSAQVRRGPWQLCSEPNFRGDCMTLQPGDYPSLAAIGLNNRVSSLREVGAAGPRPPRGVVLFEGRDFSGRRLRVDEAVDNLGGFNDRAQSAIVYDGEWEFCEHMRYAGGCAAFSPGEYRDLGRLGGELSSLRPAGGSLPGQPPGGGVRAVLYTGPDFRGQPFVIANNVVRNLAREGFNDRASSLRVERGYWLFCSDADFEGVCRTFGPGDYARLPAGLDDRISSGRRIHERYPYQGPPNWENPVR